MLKTCLAVTYLSLFPVVSHASDSKRMEPGNSKAKAAFLKKATPAQKEIITSFEKNLEAYCQYFTQNCAGSICGMCVPVCYSTLKIREQELMGMLEGSSLRFKDGKPKTKFSRMFFAESGKTVCALPPSAFKKKPRQCLEAYYVFVEETLPGTVALSADEGDVCAQLGEDLPVK